MISMKWKTDRLKLYPIYLIPQYLCYNKNNDCIFLSRSSYLVVYYNCMILYLQTKSHAIITYIEGFLLGYVVRWTNITDWIWELYKIAKTLNN